MATRLGAHAPWPDASELRDRSGDGDPLAFAMGAEVLSAARRAKTEAKRSLRWPVELIAVSETGARAAALQSVVADVQEAANATSVTIDIADEGVVLVTLAADPDEA